ncbi:DUF411 domain-containing protein [Rhizobium sp. BG4]|uniref:DUF411 domain-containing protein n=1 Tax=Rhizobium sp. BG4 TaxID=2613770 RepID=UPI00193D209B|nr:DUF411 domain-containing protein [Rhizobium sp. BG4]QRM45147.1 DUF411 domain-containing protein [Rhizobium sp. BG4]
MNRRSFICLAVTGLAVFAARSAIASQKQMDVYKDPTCGCCGAWAAAMADADFNVIVHDVDDLASVKTKYGIPAGLQGCHTAVVGDYVFEGHVPLEAVEKVLSEKPSIAGLAVPGMPAGSLGMGDNPNASYEVYSLGKQGAVPAIYMKIGA